MLIQLYVVVCFIECMMTGVCSLHMKEKVLFDPVYGVFGNRYDLKTLYPKR